MRLQIEISKLLERLVEIDETIPEYIDRTVMKAMAIDKKIRFQTVDDFEAAFIHEQEVLYPEEELRKLRIRKRLFFGMLGCIVVALVGVTFYIQHQRSIGIKNIEITEDKISIAFPYSDDRDKQYLQEIVSSYKETHNQIEVDVQFINKNVYSQTINKSI